MNFLFYYGIGLAIITGKVSSIAIFTTYLDDMGIKSWGVTDWIRAITAILLLPLIWPVLIINNIVSVLHNQK